MQFQVPSQLETERLILRPFQDEDWKALYHYYCSAEATRYTVGRSLSEGETWRIMCSMIGHWQLRGYGPYAVEEKSSGELIGTVGFWYPNDWPSPEIKWALAPEYWGKGYASEAARAIQQVGHEYLPDIHLISLIHRDNNASKQLALAVGATLEQEIDFRGDRWLIYRHPAKQ